MNGVPDRGKVVEWLTEISLRPCDFATDDFDAYETEHNANDALELISERDAYLEQKIALLKEQEAVEPVLIREGRNKNYNDYVCPRCDNEVVYEQNYCSECGVQFLWEGR